MAVSFDLFGTLVTADRPSKPWAAVADELAARGVAVPEQWEATYRESHHDTEPGAELSLVAHTTAALASRGVTADRETVAAALRSAFGGPVAVREGAAAAVRAAEGPVAVCSNCSLPGLVGATLDRTDLPAFDAVVTSVGCGWRKPHDRVFELVADRLGIPLTELVHVGDDPRADGGARTAGATVVLTEQVPLPSVPARLEGLT